ncbi:MAG TPA: beta-propeller fold lactonase family protein [Methylomirabilota bacterium]|jgi:YVTN family beta-propeller protein|nr:beta-propeller fold lactonase family protein [Methylomirabilota bacterium]
MIRAVLAVWLLLAAWSVDASADELYVSNTHSGTISVIDTGRDEVVATIALGGGVPNRIVLTPDGTQAWAIHDKSRVISVVDVAARKVLRRIKIGEWPYNLSFTPDGRYCWVLDWGDVSKLLIYDVQRGVVDGEIEVSTWPAHGIFSRDGKLFWVTSETAGNVTVVDVPQRKILEILPSSGDAMGLTLSADGHYVYAANGEDRTVSKIDTRTHKILATGKVKGVNHDAVLTPDGRFLYVTLRKANRIAVLRTEDLEVVTEIPQPGYPDLVVMANDGTKAYVSNRHANLVTVIDLSDHRETKRIPVGKGPHGMALSPHARP